MSNYITDLRDALFAELRALGDKSQAVDLDRTRAIVDVSQTLINSARVEVEFVKAIGGKGSGFITGQPAPQQVPNAGATPMQLAVGNVVGHKKD